MLVIPLIVVLLKKSVPSGNLQLKITAAVSGPPPGMKPHAVSHLEVSKTPNGMISLKTTSSIETSPLPGNLPYAPSLSKVVWPPPGLLLFGVSPSNGALLPRG